MIAFELNGELLSLLGTFFL